MRWFRRRAALAVACQLSVFGIGASMAGLRGGFGALLLLFIAVTVAPWKIEDQRFSLASVAFGRRIGWWVADPALWTMSNHDRAMVRHLVLGIPLSLALLIVGVA